MGIQQKVNIGQQVTVKSIADQFAGKPYGWDQTSTLVVTAHLRGADRITIEHNGNVLKRTEVSPLLKNSHQLSNLKVGVQKSYDNKKVSAFRKFVTDFFDEGAPPKEPLELAHFGADKLKDQLVRLKEARTAYDYPFIAQLDPSIALLEGVVGKTDEWYLTEFALADELLEAKESALDPIRAFLKDNRKSIYDEVRGFLRSASDNLGYLPEGAAVPVQALLDDLSVFRGNRILDLQNEADALREQVEVLVQQEQDKAANAIDQRRTQLTQSAEYMEATEAGQAQALGLVDRAIEQVKAEKNISKLRLAASDFATSVFPSLIADLAAARAGKGPVSPEPPTTPQPQSVPVPTVHISTVDVGGKFVLTTSADVDEYIEALRAALQSTIAEGKRVTR